MNPSQPLTISGTVFTTTQFVGFHRWPGARPDQPEAPAPVGYLADRHRHLFKVRLEVSVEHNDREIEFHTLGRQLHDFLGSDGGGAFVHQTYGEIELGAASCEAIALRILDWLTKVVALDRLFYRVEVSEDGENGAVVDAVR